MPARVEKILADDGDQRESMRSSIADRPLTGSEIFRPNGPRSR